MATAPRMLRRPGDARYTPAVELALARGRACGVIVVLESDPGSAPLPEKWEANVNVTFEQTADGWDVRAVKPALHVQLLPTPAL